MTRDKDPKKARRAIPSQTAETSGDDANRHPPGLPSEAMPQAGPGQSLDVDRIRHLLNAPLLKGLSGGALEQLAGDASTRRYYRIRGAGHSVILTLYPEPFRDGERAVARLERLVRNDPAALLSFANDPLAQMEMTRFLVRHGLPVPPLVAVDGRLGIIAFEDLGDTRLVDALEDAGPHDRLELYRRAVDLVVQLQRVTPALKREGVIGARLEFSAAKLMWEMDFFLSHYFGSYLGAPLSGGRLEAVRAELEPLCRWLAGRPQVLCHRDYHARNLMVCRDALFMIDYQDARLGPATYDLVSLLLDPYVPPAWVDLDLLLEHYRTGMGLESGADFETEWRAMGIQRLLKACGTYAYQTSKRGAASFETYLRPSLERAMRKMSMHGGFPRTLEALSAA